MGLNPNDPGVRLLGRSVARTHAPGEVLLVHCGELAELGEGATRLILDVREHTHARSRCVADVGPHLDAEIGGPFAAAAVWPRAHLGKDFSEACLARGALSLREGGRLYCAVRKAKGGKSLGKTMKALLGSAQVEDRDRGYHLWVGERGPDFDEALARELVGRSYLVDDPLLPEGGLRSLPGVFSRRELDAGTRGLLEVAAVIAEQEEAQGLAPPRRVLDLCAGIGPLALWAAHRWPAAEVLAVESNLRAAALLEANAAAEGPGEPRVRVLAADGMPARRPASAVPELARPFVGAVDWALINPPTHADPETLARLLDLRGWLSPKGSALLVVNRPGRAVDCLQAAGATIEGGERDGYYILRARFA